MRGGPFLWAREIVAFPLILVTLTTSTNYSLFCTVFRWWMHSLQFVNCAVPNTTGNTTILSNLVFIYLANDYRPNYYETVQFYLKINKIGL